MTRPFTGRHMAAIIISFFAVIIAVNLTMAYFARSSWTGLVVKNSYVASQSFNRDAEIARQQQALGWQMTLSVKRESVQFIVLDRDNQAMTGLRIRAVLQRPTDEAGRPASQAAGARSRHVQNRRGHWRRRLGGRHHGGKVGHRIVRFVQRIFVK